MRHARERDIPAVRSIDIQEQRKVGRYLIVDSLPALIALAQRYIIELHTWQATADHLEQPDRIVLDLDPGDEVPWPDLIAATRLVRDALEALKLKSWLKTTGGKGLHVVVPFRAEHDWDTCLAFARGISSRIMQHDPRRFTISTAHRAERARMILIDYLRNARTATAVAAYSVRARAMGTVSVPLAWEELTPKLDPQRWTVKTVPGRLRKMKSDPWQDYWRSRQRLTRAMVDAVGG
jgi:bifunctional non-homologous end joining protein LigD